MNDPQRRSKRIWLILAICLLTMLFCCGIPLGLIDRYGLLHIHDYEQTKDVSMAGVAVTVDVHPGERIMDPPERLQGPPYALTMMLNDASRTAVSATLHGARLELKNGQQAVGEITVDDKKWQPQRDFVLLYFNFGETVWDRRPVIVADLEINFAERSERATVRIPMRASHRRTVYIP